MKITKRRKPKSRNPFIKILIFLIFTAAVIFAAMTLLSSLNYEPNVGSNVSPYETQFIHGDIPNPDSDVETVETEEEITPPPVIEDHSRKEGMYNFLVIGRDSVAFNTDVIMLISFNTASGEITVMQIPRDTYIESGGKSYKINALYAAKYNAAKYRGSKDPLYEGMIGVVETLETNLYIQIDYWAVVNLEGFSNIVDSIGGVEIDIPFEMNYDDPDQNLHIHLKPGVQTLNGEQSEQFVRFRSNYIQADIGRINAQKIFISAFLRQLKNNLNIKTVGTFAKEALEHTMTSIDIKDCIYFAKAAMELDLSQIKMFTLPGTDARSDGDSGTWYYVMYRADTLALINRYFNVYKSDVTNTVFDFRLAFTNEEKPHLNTIYNTKSTIDAESFGSTASDINDNSIDIPLLHD